MSLATFIAGRYLFAKKSHNVINIISAISAIGMAIGTAALIIILSVYNGFDSLIRSMMSNVEPDILICPSTGKTFVPAGETYDWIYEQPEVISMLNDSSVTSGIIAYPPPKVNKPILKKVKNKSKRIYIIRPPPHLFGGLFYLL